MGIHLSQVFDSLFVEMGVLIIDACLIANRVVGPIFGWNKKGVSGSLGIGTGFTCRSTTCS